MPLPPLTRQVLQYYATHASPDESVWYGPWSTILITLFPASDGFQTTPQRKPRDEHGDRPTVPDFVIEVARATEPEGLGLQPVLIVGIKNSHRWPDGIEPVFAQLRRQANAVAFSRTACAKVYWIAVIGPHWRYGSKEDGQLELSPLIPWHDTTHDDASFADMQTSAGLVRAL